RGLKGLKEMFLGSVSNYVTHHAPCSVLILRSAVDSESDVQTAQKKARTDSQQEIATN
ncbi:MAG: universal stress protein, partial [Waterburya sp.]